MSTPAPVPGPAPAPAPAQLVCKYCSCPPQVDPGCPPNNAACANPCPAPVQEEGGMPVWAIILLIICVIIVLIVGISWASTGNPFAMAELFTLMLQ